MILWNFFSILFFFNYGGPDIPIYLETASLMSTWDMRRESQVRAYIFVIGIKSHNSDFIRIICDDPSSRFRHRFTQSQSRTNFNYWDSPCSLTSLFQKDQLDLTHSWIVLHRYDMTYTKKKFIFNGKEQLRCAPRFAYVYNQRM